MKPLAFLVCALANIPFAPAQTTQPVTIRVHAAQPTGPYTPIWNYFGADEPNYIYAPNGEKLLNELRTLGALPIYFRVHNLLTTGNGDASPKWGSTNVYTERPDGSPVYDFTITDRIFDTLVSFNIRPIVEIGFMPEALSTHPEPYRHTFPKGSIFTGWSYPPKDEAKWSALVLAYATHLRDRYGTKTRNWLWEVWNEPDIPYWHGKPDEYFRLYDLTAAAIRKALPEARIGGPEATGISDHSEPFFRAFLDHCANGKNDATGGSGAPLDFISYHPKGSVKFSDGHATLSLGTQLRAAERGMKIIASDPRWRTTPIVLGEFDPEGCAACTGPQSAWRNGPLYAASVADSMMRLYELAKRNNVKLEGAVTWAFEFEDQPAFAGYRELATSTPAGIIDKPVLNVFRIMDMLGSGTFGEGKPAATWLAVSSTGAQSLDDILAHSITSAPDINAVATRQRNEIDILLWNFHDTDLDAAPATISLLIDGLKGRPRWTEYRMDSEHANSYAAWLKMGSPAHPDVGQLAALKQAGELNEPDDEEPVHWLDHKHGTAALTITLPRQSVVLISIQEKLER
jgi:xylan 1,4-beta-xylosidase